MNKVKTKESVVRNQWGSLSENIQAILIAVVLALFIRTFVVQAFKIPSGSMLETLQIGDHILVSKFIYGTRLPFTETSILPVREPQRGDIIVFKYPMDKKRDFIKRLIGLPGDKVVIKNKIVYVNGEALKDDYVVHRDENIIPGERDNFGPVTVPEGSYFVMGDNRDGSFDSRFWGYVQKEEVIGKALIIYWSWDREKTKPRMGRFGMIVD